MESFGAFSSRVSGYHSWQTILSSVTVGSGGYLNFFFFFYNGNPFDWLHWNNNPYLTALLIEYYMMTLKRMLHIHEHTFMHSHTPTTLPYTLTHMHTHRHTTHTLMRTHIAHAHHIHTLTHMHTNHTHLNAHTCVCRTHTL